MIGHCLEAEDYVKFRIILLEILAALEKKDGAAELSNTNGGKRKEISDDCICHNRHKRHGPGDEFL